MGGETAKIMGLELTASISTIASLNVAWPVHDTDPYSECDNHCVNIKLALQRTFLDIPSQMSATTQQIHNLMRDGAELSVTGRASVAGVVLLDNDADFVNDGVVVGSWVTNTDTGSARAAIGVGSNSVTLSDFTMQFAKSASYSINNPSRNLQSAMQGQLTQLTTDRQTMSESVNASIQVLSATLNTQIQTMSESVNASIQTLSATLTNMKLHVSGVSSTAANAINWGNAGQSVGSDTPASPATNHLWFQL